MAHAHLSASAFQCDCAVDPLVAAIDHYRLSGEAFEALPDELSEEEAERAGAALCLAPHDVLANWTEPATTREGAAAAVRLALDELTQDEEPEPMLVSLLSAAMGFLESRILSNDPEDFARDINNEFDRFAEKQRTAGARVAIDAATASAFAAVTFLDQAHSRVAVLQLINELREA